ncbi:hypothetical protein AURDEDRAFT_178328 [Auricularia subglabra TFB-10046 SS5]|uniref:Uncharacterized protein n=1 Tax=Auricularia subglabra (strain TFB-10046 / SS5) TaxID=717982 RepID=J0D1W2_AURST|nr:hypothetical protein AURDEDRAFT_178328 [Auricularia subglabra TFB-10046 SS5]
MKPSQVFHSFVAEHDRLVADVRDCLAQRASHRPVDLIARVRSLSSRASERRLVFPAAEFARLRHSCREMLRCLHSPPFISPSHYHLITCAILDPVTRAITHYSSSYVLCHQTHLPSALPSAATFCADSHIPPPPDSLFSPAIDSPPSATVPLPSPSSPPQAYDNSPSPTVAFYSQSPHSSYIYGPSTHNTRMESLWLDVASTFGLPTHIRGDSAPFPRIYRRVT